METLTALVEEQGRAFRNLELEWIQTYDKVRHQLSRMAKRGTLPPGKGEGANAAQEGSEGDGMDPISRNIHQRRRRGFLRPPGEK